MDTGINTQKYFVELERIANAAVSLCRALSEVYTDDELPPAVLASRDALSAAIDEILDRITN